MLTLENFIMEQEISEASVADIYIEQAFAELEVSAAIVNSYAKQCVMLEYNFDENYVDDVVMEHDDPNKPSFYEDPRNGVRIEKIRGKFDSVRKWFANIGNVIIIALQNIYNIFTRVPVSTLKKRIEQIKKIDGEHFEIKINQKIVVIIKYLVEQANDLKDAIRNNNMEYLNRLATSEGLVGSSDQLRQALKDISPAKVPRKGTNAEISDALTTLLAEKQTYDANEFIEKVLNPLEKMRVDTKVKPLIKEYKDLAKKTNAELGKEARKEALNGGEEALFSRANVAKVTAYVKQLSIMLTKAFTEYSKDVNKALKDRYDTDKKIAADDELKARMSNNL